MQQVTSSQFSSHKQGDDELMALLEKHLCELLGRMKDTIKELPSTCCYFAASLLFSFTCVVAPLCASQQRGAYGSIWY